MDQTRSSLYTRRIWLALIPYITIGLGLLVLRNAWAAIVSYHLGMAVVLVINRKTFSLKRALVSRRFTVLILTAVLCGSGGLLLFFLWPFLGIPADINLYMQNIGLTATVWPYLIAYFLLINPWLEEFFWRGFLGSDFKGLILADGLFAGYHLLVLAGIAEAVWLAVVFILLLFAAWSWRQINRWNGGLATSILSHLVADASIIFVIYFMTSG